MKKLFSFAGNKEIHPLQMGLFILIELLLIFGKEFSKFHLFSFFYLYDVLFFLLGFWAFILILIRRKFTFHWPLVAMIVISIIYLVWSYFMQVGPLNYMVRHYALFLYLIIFYIIYESFIDEKYHRTNIRFIILIGFFGTIFHIGHLIYKYIVNGELNLFGEFNYNSYMTIMGVVIFCAWAITYPKKIRYKIIFYVGGLLLSTTIGHASAFFASFAIGAFYIISYAFKQMKIQLAISFVLLVICFRIFVPSFSDDNSEWRLIYWKHILIEQFTENYGIMGKGFGGNFVKEGLMEEMKKDLNQNVFDFLPEERLLSPPHNSFITIIFHIGFLPGLLLLLPLRDPYQYFMRGHKNERFRVKDMILFSFVGLSVWSSFNVILELPHSSAFFWLVYFTLIFEFRKGEKKIAEEN